jgi:RHS repeat-associated protein
MMTHPHHLPAPPTSEDDDTFASIPSAAGLAGNPLQTYVFGTYVDEPLAKIDSANGTLYYHTNRQYSVTALTDATGSAVERYTYTAYGVTTILTPDGVTLRATSAVNNPYLYTGRQLDPEFAADSTTATYYYRARYYDPTQGRFIGRDPLEYVDGMSLYAGYFAGRFSIDPSGRKDAPYIDVPVPDVHWTKEEDAAVRDSFISAKSRKQELEAEAAAGRALLSNSNRMCPDKSYPHPRSRTREPGEWIYEQMGDPVFFGGTYTIQGGFDIQFRGVVFTLEKHTSYSVTGGLAVFLPYKLYHTSWECCCEAYGLSACKEGGEVMSDVQALSPAWRWVEAELLDKNTSHTIRIGGVSLW